MKRQLCLLGAALLLAGAASAQEAVSPPPPFPAGPQAQVQTSLGNFVIALDPAHAPATVKNFVAYARSGYFDGTVVYRVVPRFVVQMGSVMANGLSSGRPPRKPIPLETAGGLKNVRGAVAMARGDKPASATGEFFIDLSDTPYLDAKPEDKPNTTGYAVFGQVVAGLEVVDAISNVTLNGGLGPFPDAFPKKPVRIFKVTVSDKPLVMPPPPAPPTEPAPLGAAAAPNASAN
jgi:cyclophilin family peptidyl-prolyl cis-trans isomerase